MGRFNYVIRNITVLFIMTFIGLLTGFSLGVIWTADQALGITDLNYKQALHDAEKIVRTQADQLQNLSQQLITSQSEIQLLKTDLASTPPAEIYKPPTSIKLKSSFTGEDLMQAVNKYRREHGVPELQLQGSLCQLASFRLGEIIANGGLDNHAGFEAYFKTHEINELGVSNVAENLASGYANATDVVNGWDSSPPHRTFLLADGSYKYGCGAGNLGYAVLIGGY